ncbi:MAG: glucokinase [Nitrospina sp.]|nr:glucokinase [Nitrospina sp.]
MILAGDIGGTKVNLALFDNATCVLEKRYESRIYSGVDAILEDFLSGKSYKIEKACFGVAGPVAEGKCSLTNLPWLVEEQPLKELLDLNAVYLINDLVATAHSIPILGSADVKTLQPGNLMESGNIVVIAAGTGLGQAFLTADGNGKYRIMSSEGGHCDFSPRNRLETELLYFLQKKYSRVSIERVLSGSGLLDIFAFLKSVSGEKGDASDSGTIDSPESIIDRAFAQESQVCEKTLRLFILLYGALAGNLALQYLSQGGVYLAGGIAPKIAPVLKEYGFMEAFLAKGRFAEYLSKIPVKIVMNEKAPLLGAVQYATVL